MKLPRDLHALPGDGARVFAAPEIEAWVRTALASGTGLYEAATEQADLVLEGRGPVPVVRTSRGRWVVRRYRRGGLVAAPLMGDRYLRIGLERPLREACASDEVRRRGIATPRVMAGAVYTRGLFYRADLVTEYVASGCDLASALFHEQHAEAERADILASVGALVARTAGAGIEHRDLNAKNVLIDRSTGRPVPLLLDLDRLRVRPPGVHLDPTLMIERLTRSLTKHANRTGREPRSGEWAALRRGAGLGVAG